MSKLELFPYQQEAVDFIAKNRKVYIALDMGMGKTITSLYAGDQLGGNILLVAEKNEIENNKNFQKELEKFFPEYQYHNLRSEEIDHSRKWVAGINPDSIGKIPERAIEEHTTLIVDEATLAKNVETKRFQNVARIAEKAENVILLSGTPMMNGATELYAPLMLLKHPLVYGKGAKGKYAFDRIFAGGYWKVRKKLPQSLSYGYVLHNPKLRNVYLAWWAKGANNVRVLRYLLRDILFVKTKEETNIFKKKHRTVKYVPMTPEWKEEFNQAWADYFEQVEQTQSKRKIKNVKAMKNLIEKGQCYQVNSRWKAKYIADDIAKGVYGKDRIVIFTLFVETYFLLQELLKEKGITYKTFDEVDEWKAGDEQVIIGRIKAHGKGTNLAEANVCLFVDMDFVPAINTQAENRIDRPEQRKEMKIVYYLTENNEVDDFVRNTNRQKTKNIREFMRPFSEEELSMMSHYLEGIRMKYPEESEVLGI